MKGGKGSISALNIETHVGHGSIKTTKNQGLFRTPSASTMKQSPAPSKDPSPLLDKRNLSSLEH